MHARDLVHRSQYRQGFVPQEMDPVPPLPLRLLHRHVGVRGALPTTAAYLGPRRLWAHRHLANCSILRLDHNATLARVFPDHPLCIRHFLRSAPLP